MPRPGTPGRLAWSLTGRGAEWMAGRRDGLMMCLYFCLGWVAQQVWPRRLRPLGAIKSCQFSHFCCCRVAGRGAAWYSNQNITRAAPHIPCRCDPACATPVCRKGCGFQRIEPASRPGRRSLGRKRRAALIIAELGTHEFHGRAVFVGSTCDHKRVVGPAGSSRAPPLPSSFKPKRLSTRAFGLQQSLNGAVCSM